MNYTKGEWINHKLYDEGYDIYQNGDGDGHTIARVFQYNGEQETNANLIAAAPDMYETLKKALLLLNRITTEDFSCGKDKPLRQRLEKVIAKAEGK